MNVLWITNISFGKLMDLAGLKNENTSGSWLNAALADFIDDRKFKLTVVTVGRVQSIKTVVEKNITYCLLPGGYPFEYNYKKESNKKNWIYIKEKFRPDIIHVWGTEFTHGHLALKLMSDIPSVIYIQGLLESIYRYYYAGMTSKDLLKSITLRDIIKFDWISRRKREIYKKSFTEAEMIKTSGHVIVENNWCSSHCLNIYHKCAIHKCELNIREEFFNAKWTDESFEPFSIMCSAAGYPIKGLHVLIKALSNIVIKYPETKLYVPGQKSPLNRKISEAITENGYGKYIRTLIKKFKLEKNIIFMGRLSAEQMAKKMANSNVFVVPSSIENHSSTLIEAMVVGVPCIASYVGGIPEYLKHNKNGLLYRFEESEMLAEQIKSIFSDLAFAVELGNNASLSARSTRLSVDLKAKLISVYDNVINSYVRNN
jgi:L-malate glycosyltransferase